MFWAAFQARGLFGEEKGRRKGKRGKKNLKVKKNICIGAKKGCIGNKRLHGTTAYYFKKIARIIIRN